MEHLKLFSARINIPRLIRVCEEFQHWPELVFLYVQYDEFDNAALIMIAHSPTAWEHSHFKDTLVKVTTADQCIVQCCVCQLCIWRHSVDLYSLLVCVRSNLAIPFQ